MFADNLTARKAPQIRRKTAEFPSDFAENARVDDGCPYFQAVSDNLGVAHKFADLVLNGDPEAYLKAVTEHKPFDS